MIVKKEYCDVNFWFALGDAGLSAEDISWLIRDVPKSTEIVDNVVYKGNKKFLFAFCKRRFTYNGSAARIQPSSQKE